MLQQPSTAAWALSDLQRLVLEAQESEIQEGGVADPAKLVLTPNAPTEATLTGSDLWRSACQKQRSSTHKDKEQRLAFGWLVEITG